LDEQGHTHEKRSTPPKKSLLRGQSTKTERTSTKVKTNKFIAALRVAPDNDLVFVDLEGHAVRRGYHLTELKAASFETVDCGGHTNRWQETIAQLWVPVDPDNDYMSAGKFLQIFDKVGGMIPLDLETEIRVEYGDEDFFPSTYHVRSVARAQGVTRVLLEPPSTSCKARDRRAATFSSENCCCASTQSCC
jgi:Family of unknown function (DUF6428)